MSGFGVHAYRESQTAAGFQPTNKPTTQTRGQMGCACQLLSLLPKRIHFLQKISQSHPNGFRNCQSGVNMQKIPSNSRIFGTLSFSGNIRQVAVFEQKKNFLSPRTFKEQSTGKWSQKWPYFNKNGSILGRSVTFSIFASSSTHPKSKTCYSF